MQFSIGLMTKMGVLNGINNALKTSGQLVCEFGGKGCAETVHSELERLFAKRGLKYKRTFYFRL